MRNAVLMSIALSLAPSLTRAQADAALDAPRVSQHLVLDFERNRFAMDRSGKLEELRPLNGERLLSIRSGVNVMLLFLNPLRHEWRLSTESKPDPLTDGVARFLTLASTFPVMESAPAAAVTAAADPMRVLARDEAPRPSSRTLDSPFADPSMIEWLMWTDAFPSCLPGSSRDGARRDALALDQLLYGKRARAVDDNEIQVASDFAATLRDAVVALRDAANMSDLREAIRTAGAATKRLRDANARTKRLADVMEATGTSLGGSSVSTEGSAVCAQVPAYTQRVFAAATGRAREAIARREALVTAFEAMEREIRARVPRHPSDVDGFLIGDVMVQRGHRATVTVTVTSREVDVSNDVLEVKNGDSRTIVFNVMEHQSMVTELKPGIAFTAVTFPRYKTNSTNGQHVIAEAEEYRPRTIPMEMLNLVPNTGWSGFSRLVGQIGIGITKEAAVVLAGGGIRFSAPFAFTLTGGALLPFIQELKDGVKVGDAVAGEADLTNKVERVLARKAAFYVGIQR